MNYNGIIESFEEHLKKSSKKYWNDYYVGVTGDLETRLFDFHKVPKNGLWYIWCRADDENVARNVEKYFLEKGMQGDTGGGNNPLYVYCYEITQYTRETE